SLADRVEDTLKVTEGGMYVNNPIKNLKSDIRLKINKDKAQSLGVPTVNIATAVRTAIAGSSVGTYTDPNDNDKDYDIQLTVPRLSYPDLTIFDAIYVNDIEGGSVPIKQVADFELESSPTGINRLNKVRNATVTSFVQKGYLNDEVIQNVIDK